MYLTGVNFINVFGALFSYKIFLAAFFSYVLALAKNPYEKRAPIMLMKLTTPVTNFCTLHYFN